MPTISQFFGIAVRMYYDDHAPPHFHAYYGEHHTVIEIDTLAPREEYLPRRAMGLVLEWASEHRDELRANWQRAEQHQPLIPISPLD